MQGTSGCAAWAVVVALGAAAGGVGAAQPPPEQKQAQEPEDLTGLSLEQLMKLPVESVYTASKYEQNIGRAPASVSIVTADDIARFGYRTLAEILGSVPGIYATDDRNYTYLGFRGFSRPGDFNTRILLLIDGHRVNDALYGLMYVGQEGMLDVDMIERVEIIRGPGSSIYGNSAIFGVVNVFMRRGSAIDGAEFSASAGSFGTYTGRLSYGTKLANGAELMLSASGFSMSGQHSFYYPEFDAPETNFGRAIDSDHERAFRFMGSLSWRELTVSAGYSDRFRQPPTAPYGTVFNSGQMSTTDKRGYLDLKFEHVFSGDLQMLVRTSFDWYPYDAVFPYENPTPPPDPVINLDTSEGRWAHAEVQFTRKLFGKHILIFGAEGQNNLSLKQSNYNVDPFESFSDTENSSRNSGLYVQGEFQLSKALLLNAGVRHDRFKAFGGTTNPRLGLIYSPRENMTFKLLHGNAFRAPSEYEVNYQSRIQATSAGLNPERIRTHELVYEQQLADNLRMSVSGYDYRIEQLISLVTDPLSGEQTFQNIDRADARGIELQLEGIFTHGVKASAGLTLQRAEDNATGLQLSNSPRQLAEVDVSVPLYRDEWFGSIQLQHRGKAITVARDIADSYLLVNATLLTRKLFGRMELSCGIYNVLDKTYSHPSADTGEQDTIEQNGRNYRAKAVWRF